MKSGWDSTCSMRLGSKILGVLPILCIAVFKRRENWVSLYQMETICPPGYHHNGFVATHAFGDMMYIHPSCFCEIWWLCVLWITSDHLYKYIYYINIYTHTNTHTYIYIYNIIIYIYTFIYIHTYIYMYIYVYIYRERDR